MVGYRKILLGIFFLVCSTFLAYRTIETGGSLMDLSTAIGAMAAGVFSVVWGNVKEKKVL